MIDAPVAPDSPKTLRSSRSRRLAAVALAAAVVCIALVARNVYQRYTNTHIQTDNAHVEGTVYTVASRTSGTVVKIAVSTNQRVGSGDILVEIDPNMAHQELQETEVARQQEAMRVDELEAQRAGERGRISMAEAGLAGVLSQKQELAAAVSIQDAVVRSQWVILDQARSDLARAESLVAKKVVSQEQFENAQFAFETAQASLQSAEAVKKQREIALANHATAIAQARADVEVKKARLTQADAAIRTHEALVKGQDAQVRLAQLNLGYTTITAPADGFVTKKAINVGNQIQAGQPLMSVVAPTGLYVIANYKETQIHRIGLGQQARIRVDALPGREFTGKVDSIMAGTGAAFSLFPPEHASGSYMKVVERIPVKITLDPSQDPEGALRVGMSVIATVLAKE